MTKGKSFNTHEDDCFCYASYIQQLKINYKRMKKLNILTALVLTIILLLPLSLFAQKEEKDMRPVRDPFNSSLLLDRQTIISPREKGLEFIIHHRFGTMQNGISDLFGVYAPSNIRLGLDYGLTEKLMLGFGTEKNSKLQEFHAKYSILQQTRGGSIPVSVSYYVNMAIDVRDAEAFGSNYAFTNRLSYFHQIIVARKFSDKLSVQISPEYSHFNAVDSIWQNDHLGVGIAGRYKLFGDFALIAEYDQPFPLSMVRYYQKFPKANMALGIEVGTGTHCFQIFAANFDKITPQKNLANNMNSFSKGEFLVGMNVLVRF